MRRIEARLALVALALAACAPGEQPAETQAPSSAPPPAVVSEPEADVPAALRELHDPKLDPVGTWSWNRAWWSRTALWARRDGDALELEIRERTDVGPSAVTCRARWTGVSWELEAPGQRLDFRRLYPVFLDGEECLMPDTVLDDFAPGQGVVDADGEVEDYAFRRCAPESLAAWREQGAAMGVSPSGR